MPDPNKQHLYLPAKDRSFWKNPDGNDSPLLYLAWGHRNFIDEPIPESTHEGWVCVCIEEGWPSLKLNNEPQKLTAGMLALMGPDCPYGWERKDAGDCQINLWMWQDLHLKDLLNIPRNGHAVITLNKQQETAFTQIHERCREEVLRLDSHSQNYLEGCQKLFETTLARAINQPQPQHRYAIQLDTAKTWILEHLDSKEPVNRLCDYLNISQSTLHRLFKNGTGISPQAYFHEQKMNASQRMLKDDKLSVKEIAFQLGYDHFNDFSRAYKKHFGKTPTQS